MGEMDAAVCDVCRSREKWMNWKAIFFTSSLHEELEVLWLGVVFHRIYILC